MMLIADAGTTKVDWVLLGERRQHFVSRGFNPNYFPAARLDEILDHELDLAASLQQVERLVYYGSGCGAEDNRRMIAAKLQQKFPKAEPEVHHDLLGTARALCQHEAGIACILGTGSNSCAYNGREITDNVPSIGWILGDYGSGTYIGKTFIKNYLLGLCPNEINLRFREQYQLEFDQIIQKVYREEGSGHFLAQFTHFVGQNIRHRFMEGIVREAFEQFIRYQVRPYHQADTLPVHFSGSVAVHFRDILHQCLQQAGLKTGIITQKPIEGLIKYHKNEPLF